MEDKFLKDICLLDIIDLKFLQKFQDIFTQSVNLASIIVDNTGMITNPSNLSDFCINTRGSELGCKRCDECNIKWGKLAAQKGKPIIYKCHNGLINFVVPIMIKNKHIASIFGGKVFINKPNEARYRKIAKELGIDENEYIEALGEVKLVSFKQIKTASQLLFVINNMISEMAYKNYELIKKRQIDNLLNKTIDTTRNIFDIEKIKEYLVETLGEYFDTDRCFFVDYDKDSEQFLSIGPEKLKSPDIKSLLGIDAETNFPEFCKKLKTKKRDILIRDVEKLMKKKAFVEHKALNSLIENDTKSDYALLIQYKSQIIGLFVLHFIKKKRNLTSDELNFLKILLIQVGAVLYQSKLIKDKDLAAKNEKILKQIMLISANTFDFEKTIHLIVTETGKFFNADRCFFIGIDITTQTHKPLEKYAEYLSSENIRSHLTRQPKQGDTIKFIKNYQIEEVEFVNDITKSDLPYETKKMLMEDLSVKSYLIARVHYNNIPFGSLVLHYVNDFKEFTSVDIDMAKAISHHAAIIIHRANLHKTTQLQSEREKGILSNLPFMVWLKDTEGVLLAVNEPYAKMCGTTIDNIVGKTDYDFFPKEYVDSNIVEDLEVMKHKKTTYTEDIIIGPDGPRFHEIYKTPLFDEKGDVIGTTGFARDITERKEIDKMKNEFVSIVSHELRTPLTSIRGALGLVTSRKLGDLSDKIMDLLNIANNNCLRLITLINDILDIEKIEQGKMHFEIETLELMPLINNAIELNLQYAQKNGINLKLTNKLENVFVRVDNDRFMQVITNLISNAVKFSQKDFPVEISVNKIDSKIQVAVTNYGNEIPEEFKNRIFQKFAQADSSDSRQKGGTGLGLSISKAIIEKFGGSISFVSKDKRTVFHFELPEFIEKQSTLKEHYIT